MCWDLCTNIEDLDAVEAIQEYGNEVDFVLMSWPEYQSPVAAQCVKEMRKVNPELKLIYIGETGCGCCADDKFFELLDYEGYDSELNENFASWFGIHDQVVVFNI